jgi:hypothetical protein
MLPLAWLSCNKESFYFPVKKAHYKREENKERGLVIIGGMFAERNNNCM